MRGRLLVTFFFAACTSSGGPQGDPGPTGPTGPQGPAGPAGARGEPGLKGDSGATGAAGLTGPMGLMGTAGPQGPQGAQGVQGPAGAVLVVDGGVVTGPAGASVLVTAIAPGGATCPAGGLRVTQLSDGGTSNVCNGAQGPAGPAPSVSSLPMMSPACATGGVLVGQPDGGTLAVCNGAQGPQGLQGLQGPQGPSGSTGGAGPAGPAGPTGNTGPAGPPGPPGPTGNVGPAGPAGQTGPQGAAGAVLYLDGGVVVLSSAPVEFAGFTTATFTGNLGGVPGANQKCQAQFPSSYFCTLSDYDRSNTTVVPSTAAGAWIDFDRAASGSRDTGSCAQNGSAWANAATPFQAFGPYLTNTGGYSTTALCSLAKPLTCCRRGAAPTTFRGFTTATFTGNLGGVPGANLKCQAQFPGSIFCTIADYDRANTTAVPSSAAGAWIDFDRAVSGSRNTSSCAQNGSAWANAATPFQAFGAYLTNTGGYSTTALCSLSKPLACCDP